MQKENVININKLSLTEFNKFLLIALSFNGVDDISFSIIDD